MRFAHSVRLRRAMNTTPQNTPVGNQPKLLDQVRAILRAKHYSIRTEAAYVQWIKRYILFHNKRHSQDMGEAEINQFLSHLATNEHVASSTQNQALCAILLKVKSSFFCKSLWNKIESCPTNKCASGAP